MSVTKQNQVIPKMLIIKHQPKKRAVCFHSARNAFLMKPFHISSMKSTAWIFLSITLFWVVHCQPLLKIQKRKKPSTSTRAFKVPWCLLVIRENILPLKDWILTWYNPFTLSLLKYAVFHLFQELAPIQVWHGVKKLKPSNKDLPQQFFQIPQWNF